MIYKGCRTGYWYAPFYVDKFKAKKTATLGVTQGGCCEIACYTTEESIFSAIS
ncbi:hypothetical protein K413DRAFT_5360 [Clostridium sp. ASBs410]|nr:hypothetical protein K413DRAFT_5360 [Clostridium sp. ASBs410]